LFACLFVCLCVCLFVCEFKIGIKCQSTTWKSWNMYECSKICFLFAKGLLHVFSNFLDFVGREQEKLLRSYAMSFVPRISENNGILSLRGTLNLHRFFQCFYE
jgi:hypothetical protein